MDRPHQEFVMPRWTCLATALCCALACDGHSLSGPSGPPPIDFNLNGGAGLVARATSPSEIDLSWPAASRVTGYQLFRSTNGPAGSYALLASTGSLTYADMGLSSSTQYCYEYRSYTAHPNNTSYSALSSSACATTPVPPVPPVPPVNAPTGVDARPLGSRLVRVSWKDDSANEDGFRVERSLSNAAWTQLVTTAANTTSITDSVPSEQTVCYRVTAFAVAGVSQSSAADCTAAPAAPLIYAPSADPQAITVHWGDVSAVEDGYAVFRLTTAGDWTLLANLAANSNSYRDAAVTPGVSYRYLVRATKDSGYSDPSGPVEEAIATSLPAPPIIFAGYGPAQDWTGFFYALSVGWTDTSAIRVDGYHLQTTSDTTAWGPSITTLINSYDSNGGSSVPQYFRVMAFNAMGDSKPSEVACAELAVPPGAVTATAVDQHEIDLTWTDNTHCEYGFVILRATGQDSVYERIDEAPRNSASYQDLSAAPGTQYWYLVAVDVSNWYDDGFGPNAFSNYASATTPSEIGISARLVAPLRVARPTGKVPRLARLPALRSRQFHVSASRPVLLNQSNGKSLTRLSRKE
jgi:hypothetical protein